MNVNTSKPTTKLVRRITLKRIFRQLLLQATTIGHRTDKQLKLQVAENYDISSNHLSATIQQSLHRQHIACAGKNDTVSDILCNTKESQYTALGLSYIAQTVSSKVLSLVFSFSSFFRSCAMRLIRLAISSVFERM